MANRKRSTDGSVSALATVLAVTANLGKGDLTTGALRLTAKRPALGLAVTRFVRAIKGGKNGGVR